MLPNRPGTGRRSWAEDGASMFEYVLLVTLIAMAGIGGLIYLGKGSASPARAANNAALGVSGGSVGVSGGTPPSATWCTSGNSGCTDTIEVGGGEQYINFWATGGVSPYSYTLKGAPDFLTFQDLDRTAGKGQVAVQPPTGCSQAGTTYSNIAIVVTDSANPAKVGQLTFSLTVVKGSSC